MPRPRVLIVDDNVDLRNCLDELLQAAGYETATAGDGEAAIDLARKNPFAVVVLDLFMPKRAGFQALTALKQYCPATKILAMSGGGKFPAGDSLLIAAKLGAHRTIQKPFMYSKLVQEVQSLVGTSAASAPPALATTNP